MRKEILKKNLVDLGIYKKTTSNGKNYICKCLICGDHPDEKKKGHLYISTEDNVCHCFFCDYSSLTSSFLKRVSSSEKSKEIFETDELTPKEKQTKVFLKTTRNIYELPKIDMSFPAKRSYIKKRCNYNLEPEQIPNLVMDPLEFFRINHIDPPKDIHLGYFRDNFVGFLSKNHTRLFCRNISSDNTIKFKKIDLQEHEYDHIDYYFVRGNNPKSNRIVMSEGVFNILAAYSSDVLELRNKASLYISCNGFTYSNVLKSVCFDFQLFRPDVVILSDTDKDISKYTKFVQRNKHLLNSLDIYYNKNKGDFGEFPILPYRGGTIKDVPTN